MGLDAGERQDPELHWVETGQLSLSKGGERWDALESER